MNLRIGMIGCGAIAGFHVPALREAGFEIVSISGRPESERAPRFAEENGIADVCQDPDELLSKAADFDGMVICTPISPTANLLRRAMDTGIPVLVEKPVAYASDELEDLAESADRVLVGYNRRFYASAIRAREEVRSADSAGILAQLVLPEGVRPPDRPEDNPNYLMPFFANSVHGLDLARFVLEDLGITHVDRTYNGGGALTGLAASLTTESGAVLQFTANWGASANFSFTIDRSGRRYEMKPLEIATIYEGMDVVDPTPEVPIRSYQPRVVDRVDFTPDDLTFKPGFVAQARAFAEMIQGRDPGTGATLADAFAVLKLAEQLAGQTYPDSAAG